MIMFRTKPIKVYNMNDENIYTRLKVPVLKKRHVNMAKARAHAKYGGLANSDLFEGVLAGIRRRVGEYLEVDPSVTNPENLTLKRGVTVSTTGFLWEIKINPDMLEPK